jgi:hypothetical protein
MVLEPSSFTCKAVNALFNKHPDTSILVKFDQNGNLVTLKGEAYTPTGDTRVNFVGHGADLKQEGAQSFSVSGIFKVVSPSNPNFR